METPDCATVLSLVPTMAEREVFGRIMVEDSWQGVLTIADMDDYEDALRLFSWFGREVAKGGDDAEQS